MARFSKNSIAAPAFSASPSAANVGRQLGAVARRVRESHGLTLTDVAATAGISAGMLSRLETGRVTPSLETLVALAGALGVRPALLLQEVGDDDTGADRTPTELGVAGDACTVPGDAAADPSGDPCGLWLVLARGR